MSPHFEWFLTVALKVLSVVLGIVVVRYAPTVIMEIPRYVKNHAAASALQVVTALAAQLVTAEADGVRTLKLQGAWTPAMAAVVQARVLSELKVFGATQLKQLKGLLGVADLLGAASAPSPAAAIEALLQRIVEAQVEALRRTATPAPGDLLGAVVGTPRPTVAPPAPASLPGASATAPGA